jgi:hypothetical protein
MHHAHEQRYDRQLAHFEAASTHPRHWECQRGGILARMTLPSALQPSLKGEVALSLMY